MISHFRFSNAVSKPGQIVPGPAAPTPVNPLLPELEGLIGRQVRLLVHGREIPGKLIRTSPLLLVTEQGEVRLVDIAHVLSVAY